MTDSSSAYERLISLLDQHGASYRLIDHAPEGRTDLVSPLRGHPVAHAAKCMIVMAKLGKKSTKHLLVVVPGDARVDFGAIKTLFNAGYVSFASPEIAEELAGSVVGTVLPFAFDDRLELLVDPAMLEPAEIFFNAARLDCSIGMSSSDYSRIANPRVERVAVR